jgi:putative ABC transport system ATP-binding protein
MALRATAGRPGDDLLSTDDPLSTTEAPMSPDDTSAEPGASRLPAADASSPDATEAPPTADTAAAVYAPAEMKGTMSGAEPIIHIENVHKSYLMGKEAVPALRGVSIDIGEGEMACLMGPSGSGKTTLLNIVGGLDEPGRGHVSIEGRDIIAMSEEQLARMRLERIGFVFQTFNLLNNFTALENVEAPMVLLKRLSKKDRRARALQLLSDVGLSDRIDHYPSELSGGQQQRVAIARALANDPTMIIGDEMTGDLDSETGFEIMRLVQALNKRDGKTIVYVTHDPRMAEFADYTIHLLDGVIVSRDEDPVRTLLDVE